MALEYKVKAELEKAMMSIDQKDRAGKLAAAVKAVNTLFQGEQQDVKNDLAILKMQLDNKALDNEHMMGTMDMGMRLHESNQQRRAAEETGKPE